ncbi:MAG: phosphoglycerate dehydrogenase, partial [Gammaproteobacteria bacterium]|nr:phosphoglycerate dehydrogenase [Gammaproteobacteria bacterium]
MTLNNISVVGLERLPRERYEVASEISHPDAILLRSFKMHEMEIPPTLKAVGRAGAGVNNIPVEKMTAAGVPVFNAPGANSNAVKELVIAGMLLACRNIAQAWDFARNLEGDDASINKQTEAGKKNFGGYELPGRTLGVIGLGAIGVRVANAAIALGMKVVGFDPGITVKGAWQLDAAVQQANSVEDLLSKSDFITFHVPLIEATANLINADRLKIMKDGVVILNFARGGIVDDAAVLPALDSGKVYAYVCDFPTNLIKNHPRVVCLPHLGASTVEAEDNCAIMVAEQVREYLENGNISNAVNFPEIVLPRNGGVRLAILNRNVPNMVGQISTDLGKAGINIIDLLNKSRGEVAVTLLDLDKAPEQSLLDELAGIEGVLSVRCLGCGK